MNRSRGESSEDDYISFTQTSASSPYQVTPKINPNIFNDDDSEYEEKNEPFVLESNYISILFIFLIDDENNNQYFTHLSNTNKSNTNKTNKSNHSPLRTVYYDQNVSIPNLEKNFNNQNIPQNIADIIPSSAISIQNASITIHNMTINNNSTPLTQSFKQLSNTQDSNENNNIHQIKTLSSKDTHFTSNTGNNPTDYINNLDNINENIIYDENNGYIYSKKVLTMGYIYEISLLKDENIENIENKDNTPIYNTFTTSEIPENELKNEDIYKSVIISNDSDIENNNYYLSEETCKYINCNKDELIYKIEYLQKQVEDKNERCKRYEEQIELLNRQLDKDVYIFII